MFVVGLGSSQKVSSGTEEKVLRMSIFTIAKRVQCKLKKEKEPAQTQKDE